jgi:hypothetical protein
MEKESRPVQTSEEAPSDERVRDQEGANPAHPLPAKAETDEPARKAEMDAEIEDRFEATDN